MTLTQIDYDYYQWLIAQIKTPSTRSFNDLFDRLHNTEFVWIVPNDDNRVQDGLDLRYHFAGDKRKKMSLEGVTLLEILVSLSIRVAFTAGGDAKDWAWTLLKNVKLSKASDPLVGNKANKVEDIIYALIWRTYERNGQGGFFPMKYSLKDQTKAEIWDQMNEYVNEMYRH